MIREQMAIELWYLGIPPAQRVAVKDKDALWQSFHPSTQQRYVTDAIKLVSLLCAEVEKMGLSGDEIAEAKQMFGAEVYELAQQMGIDWGGLYSHTNTKDIAVSLAQLQKILKELEGAE